MTTLYPHLPSPQQLRYLIALSELRHFSQAAHACAVTQSTLSAGIIALEKHLNAPLLDRDVGKKVVFTPLGNKIIEKAHTSLQTLQSIAQLASEYNGTSFNGPLRVGVIPTIGPYIMRPLIELFQNNFPQIELSICEDTTQHILRKLFLGQLDILIVAIPCSCEGTQTHPLWRDPFHIIMPPNHPLAAFDEVPASKVGDYPMIMMEDGHCIKDQTVALCVQNANFHKIRHAEGQSFTASTLRSMILMTSMNLGISVIPEIALKADILNKQNVVSRPLKGEATYRTITIATRPKAPHIPNFNELLNVFTKIKPYT